MVQTYLLSGYFSFLAQSCAPIPGVSNYLVVLIVKNHLGYIFVFYCFVANYHKLSDLKTTPICYLTVSVGQTA